MPGSNCSAETATVGLDARITRIETIPLRVALNRPAAGSTLSLTHRCTIITRIHTDSDIVGHAFMGNDDDLQHAIITLIHDEMEPELIGKRVVEIENIWAATRRFTEPFLRDRRIALRAQACIDAALHDALGKVAGLPINVLWGAGRQDVPVFALGGYYRAHNDLEELRNEVAELIDFGVGGLKIKVGKKTPREDAVRVRAAREAAGTADFMIAADANQAWELRDAIEFCRHIADLDLAWIEEPCKWDDDKRQLAAIRSITGVPVTAGQSELSRHGCRELLIAGAVDFCNFDSYWGAGPTEWRKVAAMASSFSVDALQHLEPQVGLMMAAGIANNRFAEVLMPWRDPFFYRLNAAMPARPFANGRYRLPTDPGWAIELDWDYVEYARRSE